MTPPGSDPKANTKWYAEQIIQARLRWEWTLASGEDADHQPILSLKNRDLLVKEFQQDIKRYEQDLNDRDPAKRAVAEEVTPQLKQMLSALENAPEKMDFDPEEPIKPKPLTVEQAIKQGRFAEYVDMATRRERVVWAGISKKYDSKRRFSDKEIKHDLQILLGDSRTLQLLGGDDSEASKVVMKIVDVNRKQVKGDLNQLATRLEKHPGSVSDQQFRNTAIRGEYAERFDEFHGIDGGILDLLEKIAEAYEKRAEMMKKKGGRRK